MKVAVVGSTGYIAGFLLKKFRNSCHIDSVLKIDQSDSADVYLNLKEAASFQYQVLDEIDFVIFTAAISGPDQCAADFAHCWEVNVTGTCIFIREAIKRKCKVLFFSSDAVYGDIPGQIYNEESETEAQTAYGKMKKAVEDEFKFSSSFKAIRLSYVVSAKDKFVSYCLHCIRSGETAEIFHPFYRNCIVVSDVVNVVYWMITNWSNYSPFVLNVAGNELISRVRMADELNRLFYHKLDYVIVHPGEDFYRNRPSITQMVSIYMRQYHIIQEYIFTEKFQKEIKENV